MSARRLVVAAVTVGALWTSTRPADAIPVFAHRYGLTCQACHTVVPHLTPFGEAFRDRGYRIPGLAAKSVEPIAVKADLAYTSASGGGDSDAVSHGKLPRTIANEVELLLGGSLHSRTSYFAEAYLVDGGAPGGFRDAWVSQRITGDRAATPIAIRAGQFGLDLPVDPETFRETPDAYAIYSLNGFRNPFTFFAPKMGISAVVGSSLHGTSGTVSLLEGHEPGSGLASRGLDRSLYVQQVHGDFTVSAYRYDGTRPVSGADDRFWRQGYGLTWAHKSTEIAAVYQTGFDTRADEFADGLFSSGGFVQVRQDLGARAFAVARWDAVQGDDFSRAETLGLGYRLRRNMRLTVFDTVKRDPSTLSVTHTLNTHLLFAY